MGKTNDVEPQTWLVQGTGTSNDFRIVVNDINSDTSLVKEEFRRAAVRGWLKKCAWDTADSDSKIEQTSQSPVGASMDWRKIAKDFKKSISKVEFEKEHTMIIGQSGSGNGIWKTGPENHPQFASHFSSVYKQYLTEDKSLDIADSVTQTGKQVMRNMIIDLESAIQQRLSVEFFRASPYSMSDLQALFVDHDVNNLVEKPVTALLGNDE